MGWLRRFINSGTRRVAIEQEITDEMTFHRDELVAELEANGWAPADARREAQRRLGLSGALVAEGVAQDTLPWVATWRREMRQTWRGLRRRPVLFSTAVLTLALGAGVLLATATVVDRLLLAPLPLPGATRLVVLDETLNGQKVGGNPARTADYRRELGGVRGVIGVYGEQVVLGRGTDARLVQVLRAVGPFVDVLQLTAARGRVPTDDEQRDGAAVILLTDRGWQRLFGRASSVVGSQVTLRGASHQVVGVLPESVGYPADIDVVASSGPDYQRAPRGGNWLQVIGRLAPGATLESAEQEARAVARRFGETYPEHDRNLDVRLTGLQAYETRDIRTPLLLLFGAAVTVFLVVCVNVGGLLFVRAMARDHESSVRAALGAGPWAMARLSLHEAALIAVAALPVAWYIASLVLGWLQRTLAEDVGALGQVALGRRTLGVGLIMLLATTLVLAVWPAWHVVTRPVRPGIALHAATDSPSRRRVRRALVGTQVACSTVLLVLALLFSVSLREMLQRPRGFDATNVVAIRYDLDWEQPKGDIDRLAQRVLAAVDGTPGVVAAGVVDRFPLQGGTQSAGVQIYGEADVAAERADVSIRSATPEYFSAIGIPLLAGRVFVDGEAAAQRAEIVVSATFARKHFGTSDPIGKRVWLRWKGNTPEWSEVVGVVGDVRQSFRDESAVPEVYRPWSRAYWPLLHVAVRTDGAPDAMRRLRGALQQAIPDQPLASLGPLDEAIDRGSHQARALTQVMTACAAAAALLAVVGLYGLLASEMSARRREVGIRLALGARTWPLRAWLIRPGLWLTLAGVLIGVVASVPAARILEQQLFGVRSGHIGVRVTAALVLLLAGAVAALVPACRVVTDRALGGLRYE
ncbi:ABC transporter permease [Luteitalea sp.]|jgi:predicted permease|uniref:ABC transporter permease n=1 Tax=Luteitalea sp. TaxID=2004800 RepID=UPI0037C90EC7